MNQDSEAANLRAQINKLQEERDQLHRSLGEFLEGALDWTESEHPDLIHHIAALSELTNVLLAHIKDAQTDLDHIEKDGAEEFVKNYVVKLGGK